MATDGMKGPQPAQVTAPMPSDMSDWRGWLRWATTSDWAEPESWRQFTLPWTVPAQTGAADSRIEVSWTCFVEGEPGDAFVTHWASVGPSLERWWRADGRGDDQQSASDGRAQLDRHMPELVPIWERLVHLAGGEPLAANILALWNPPAFLTGCSQAVVMNGGPALVRNYDWDYRLFDATVANTGYLGRRVVGTEDCGWGLLDGINDAGLAGSLTFGGRPDVGEGFGIPLVLRYVLQTCDDVDDAVAALLRVPVHMSYNVTVADVTGRVATVFVGPGRPPRVTDDIATTNHQGAVEWVPYCEAIHSEERLAMLYECLARGDDVAKVTTALLHEPLYATRFQHGFGTLYTVVARPNERSMTYHWPGSDPWIHTLDAPRKNDLMTVALGSSPQRGGV